MKERPILFSGAMVHAILDGRKTQTRRVVKLPHNNPLGAWEPTTVGGGSVKYVGDIPAPEMTAIWHTRTGECYVCPHGDIGDRLWVRETHKVRRVGTETFEGARPTRRYAGLAYQADGGRAEVDIDLNTYQALDAKESRGWTPSIHMPRWASRITLEITGIRVERLQDISEADCIAEGIECYRGSPRWVRYLDTVTGEASHNTARDAYFALWERLNGRGSVDANPWLWVIEFLRVEPTARISR